MKICITHPGLGGGGSEAAVMVLLEYFQHHHAVTLVTSPPFNCQWLNSAYHTSVNLDCIEVRYAPMPEWLRGLRGGDAIRGALFPRFVHRLEKKFDLFISTYNFTDFGARAVQLIADLSWDEGFRRAMDPGYGGVRGLAHRPTLLRSAYLALAEYIAGGNALNVNTRSDLIVANSHWTARILRERHGLNAVVVYPPVHWELYDRQAPRSGDFVMLGRIAPDKRVDEAIELLARVRVRGHKFRFHIIGALDDSPYSARLRALVQKYGDWVLLRGGIYGEKKFAELARHSFALHMHKREAFGIAVAEQVAMGLIPFVPIDSAPEEIVSDRRLCFENTDDAVDLIDGTLRDMNLQQQIRERLATRVGQFSKEQFVSALVSFIGNQSLIVGRGSDVR